MESKHTSEQLITGESNAFKVSLFAGKEIVAICNGLPGGQQGANARRIAACWNACDGMDTEEVESIPIPLNRLARDYRSLRSQRDELMTALMALLSSENDGPSNVKAAKNFAVATVEKFRSA